MLFAAIFVPFLFSLAGFVPSKPPWKGTTNFNCLWSEPLNDNRLFPAEYFVPNVDASSLPNEFSKLIVTLLPVAAPVGNGAKYC